ncbi:MAG: CoA-binding protein [Chloroflexi bacterium]|nr:CoA-binding protein [Chloroflexota bacterium]
MDLIEQILKECHTVAVVGLSSSPERASYQVAAYLKSCGYTIVPVNPREEKVLDEKAYPDLSSVPGKIDVVDIFRRPENVLPVIDEAIKVGARAVWMQLGVANREAADRARNAGLSVVMDACMMREHRALGL